MKKKKIIILAVILIIILTTGYLIAKKTQQENKIIAQSNTEIKQSFKPVPDVACLKYKGTPDNPDIKIFVSNRIDLDSEQIDNSLFIPVRCGAVVDSR